MKNTEIEKETKKKKGSRKNDKYGNRKRNIKRKRKDA
jgi:hypothetical protein